MIYFVYILYSTCSQKSYVGYTNDLKRRMWEHNNATKKSYTSNFRPWVIIHQESFVSKESALAREKWFKSGIGRKLKDEIIREYMQT